MTENQKLQAVIDVMTGVLAGGPLTHTSFRTKCFNSFQSKWGDGSSEITVEYAKSRFGTLREFDPPFKKVGGKMTLSSASALGLHGPPKKKATKKKVTKKVVTKKKVAAKSAPAKKKPVVKKKKKVAAKKQVAPATKHDVIARIDEILGDQLSQKEIGLVLGALEDVIVEELVDKGASGFRITRVVTIDVEQDGDAAKLTARPLSRLNELS